MINSICMSLMSLMVVSPQMECNNIHCGFEYIGIGLGTNHIEEEFMRASATSELANKYCVQEFMFSFRKLNWYLYQFEKGAIERNGTVVSNAVSQVASLLHSTKIDGLYTGNIAQNKYPNSLKVRWLEKIEYSLARMILSAARDRVVEYVDILLPDAILNECESQRSIHSIKTFKKMLYIAIKMEEYRADNKWCPIELATIGISEQMRKCAYGRDIEYEHYKGRWMLRCRCESWEGGLQFDEYVPLIYTQRKHLDLCLSSTFNEKRLALYSGMPFCPHDDRLSCSVIHDKTILGVHKIKYTNPSAGNCFVKTRIGD